MCLDINFLHLQKMCVLYDYACVKATKSSVYCVEVRTTVNGTTELYPFTFGKPS